MPLSLFGYFVLIIVVGAFITAIASGIVAYRRKKLFASDFGIFLIPCVAFYIVGNMRPEFRIGWGLFLGPFITLILSLFAFGLRVAFVDAWFENARLSSYVVFAICVTVAILIAATMPPWFE